MMQFSTNYRDTYDAERQLTKALAKLMSHSDVADLLQHALDEERAADDKLSALAESGINQEAADAAQV